MSTVIEFRTAELRTAELRTVELRTVDHRQSARNLDQCLVEEDLHEDAGYLAADDRMTCHVHGRWIHQCVSSSVHVNPVTRHRWCRECKTALSVAVDELTLSVHIACPRCGDGRSAATRSLEKACSMSLAWTARKPSLLAG